MKDFSKGEFVSYQLKDEFKRQLRKHNGYQIRELCVDISPKKETIDNAVACGFLTITNVTIAQVQLTDHNNTFLYDLMLTEEGKTYIEFMLL